MVVLYHYVGAIITDRPLWRLGPLSFNMLWSGVDLFFVLSGFLISGILLDSTQSSRYFQTFYYRRIHRIFPLYFGWLAIFYLGVYFNIDGRLGVYLFKESTPLWQYSLFLQNNAPVLLGTAIPPWMGITWSLAVEEQFYLLLPALVRSASRVALTITCCGVIVMSPLVRFLLVTRYPEGWNFTTLSRLDGLAMGICITLIVRSEKCRAAVDRHSGKLRVAVASLACGYMAMDLLVPSWKFMALFGISLIVCFFAAVLLMTTCQPESKVAGVMRLGILRYFGKVSYALYLLHVAIHSLVDRAVPRWSATAPRLVVVAILAFIASVALADVSWRLIEQRMIKRAHTRYSY